MTGTRRRLSWHAGSGQSLLYFILLFFIIFWGGGEGGERGGRDAAERGALQDRGLNRARTRSLDHWQHGMHGTALALAAPFVMASSRRMGAEHASRARAKTTGWNSWPGGRVVSTPFRYTVPTTNMHWAAAMAACRRSAAECVVQGPS